MYDAASCEKRGDVAEVPPQRLRRMVIRLGRCMTRRRFIGHVMQELVSAASAIVEMIDCMMSGEGVPSCMMSGEGVPSCMMSGVGVPLSMTAGAGGEHSRSSCSAITFYVRVHATVVRRRQLIDLGRQFRRTCVNCLCS